MPLPCGILEREVAPAELAHWCARYERVAGASAPASRHMNQFGAPSTSASSITS